MQLNRIKHGSLSMVPKQIWESLRVCINQENDKERLGTQNKNIKLLKVYPGGARAACNVPPTFPPGG